MLKKMWQDLKTCIKAFHEDTEGAEFLEVAIVVVIVLGLAAAVIMLANNVGQSISNVKTEIPGYSFGG